MRSISLNNLAFVTGLFFGFSYLSNITALNITVLQPGVSFVPVKTVPLPYAASECDEIVELFQNLGRTVVWNLVDAVKFEGDTYEPEGLVRVGDDLLCQRWRIHGSDCFVRQQHYYQGH